MLHSKIKFNKKFRLLVLLIFPFIFLFLNFSNIPSNILPPHVNDTIITYDSVWVNDTLFIYETIHITADNNNNNSQDTILAEQDTTNYYEYLSRGFINPTSFVFRKKQTLFNKIITFPDYTTNISTSIFNLSLLNANSNTDMDFNDLLNNSLSPRYGVSIGNSIELSKKNILLETGYAYTVLFEKFNFYKELIDIDTSSYYKIFDVSNWKVDTILFLNLDSLLIGDTVWMQYLDSTLITTQDSTFATDYDTITQTYNYDENNTYSYIDIPIIFGYDFSYKKFIFSVKAGIIGSFPVRTSGKSFSYLNGFEAKNINEILNFRKIFFSTYTALGIKYRLGNHFGFYIEPFLRYPITHTYKNYTISRKYYSYGIKFGCQFYF